MKWVYSHRVQVSISKMSVKEKNADESEKINSKIIYTNSMKEFSKFLARRFLSLGVIPPLMSYAVWKV